MATAQQPQPYRDRMIEELHGPIRRKPSQPRRNHTLSIGLIILVAIVWVLIT